MSEQLISRRKAFSLMGVAVPGQRGKLRLRPRGWNAAKTGAKTGKTGVKNGAMTAKTDAKSDRMTVRNGATRGAV